MKFTRLTLFFLFLKVIAVTGQVNPCHKSTEGKEFWFGFMESRNYQSGHYTEITVTSGFTCKYDIFIGKSTTPWNSGTVLPNIPLKVSIDWKLVEATGSENTQDKAIHLVSDNPLNVYALNWSPNSADVAVIYPAESLGYEYLAMCYTPHIHGNGINAGNGRNSEFLVVASQDNTIVNITPARLTDKLKPANIPFQITLNKGELFQVQSENLPNTSSQGQGDLTGSYIASNKPIAFFSGSLSTTVPGDATVSAWDHLYEQIPPMQTWGRKFIAVPLMSREKDTYRILAGEDNTEVRIGTSTVHLLKKGDYHEFMLHYSTPSLIESDKPVLLAQYSNSQSVDKPFTNGDGDPFMVIVSPVNQTREKVSFVAYDSQNIKDKYFINVVVRDDAVDKIILDGTAVSFLPLSGSGYSYAQVKIIKGNHLIETTEPGKGFIAYVYGFGGVESYGYGVGFNLDIVLDLGSNINASDDKRLVRCDGSEPLSLNAGNAFDGYLWSTGATTSKIDVSEAGTYSVTASTKDGCILTDEIKLEVSKPVVNFGADRTICNPETTVLDAGASDQFMNFLWKTPQTPQPSLTDQKITVIKPGTYAVEATNKYGCLASDEISVAFTDKPKLDLSELEALVCGTFNTTVKVKTDKDVTYSLESDPNVKINGLTVSVAPADFGTYPVTLTAKDEFSCVSTADFDLAFYKTPDVDFTVNAKKCAGYNLDVSYVGDAVPAISNFKWVFAGDIIANEIGRNSLVVPLGVNRSQRELSLTVTQNGCFNSYTYDVKVIPNLELKSEPLLGCEPFIAEFKADNSEIVDYFWDFGDGSPIEKSNMNTNHLYQRSGFYDVKLKVTTIDPAGGEGCSNEVKIEKMVHVAPIPDVAFSLSADECLNPGTNKISYTGLIGTVRDRYDWDLQQFDPSEIVKHPLQTQGPFIFDLKTQPNVVLGLNVFSEFGCESALETIALKRKPDFTMASDFYAGCIPFEPFLSGIINDRIDKVDFDWNFGDGATGSGSQISHPYNQPEKTFNVTLSGTSTKTGCFNSLISNDFITTYPKPAAAFGMDNKIVYNDNPNVNFLNSSMGATAYLWDFGDGLTSDIKDASHSFGVTGYRNVLLEAFNEFQCSDTVSHQLLVAFDRIFPPNAFSPNAPKEIDREFKLGSNGVATEGYHFIILSRWNDIVFEARGEIKGWNGKMSNGSPAPAGTYVWILNFNDFLGRRHRQTGTVTLVY